MEAVIKFLSIPLALAIFSGYDLRGKRGLTQQFLVNRL